MINEIDFDIRTVGSMTRKEYGIIWQILSIERERILVPNRTDFIPEHTHTRGRSKNNICRI